MADLKTLINAVGGWEAWNYGQTNPMLTGAVVRDILNANDAVEVAGDTFFQGALVIDNPNLVLQSSSATRHKFGQRFPHISGTSFVRIEPNAFSRIEGLELATLSTLRSHGAMLFGDAVDYSTITPKPSFVNCTFDSSLQFGIGAFTYGKAPFNPMTDGLTFVDCEFQHEVIGTAKAISFIRPTGSIQPQISGIGQGFLLGGNDILIEDPQLDVMGPTCIKWQFGRGWGKSMKNNRIIGGQGSWLAGGVEEMFGIDEPCNGCAYRVVSVSGSTIVIDTPGREYNSHSFGGDYPYNVTGAMVGWTLYLASGEGEGRYFDVVTHEVSGSPWQNTVHTITVASDNFDFDGVVAQDVVLVSQAMVECEIRGKGPDDRLHIKVGVRGFVDIGKGVNVAYSLWTECYGNLIENTTVENFNEDLYSSGVQAMSMDGPMWDTLPPEVVGSVSSHNRYLNNQHIRIMRPVMFGSHNGPRFENGAIVDPVWRGFGNIAMGNTADEHAEYCCVVDDQQAVWLGNDLPAPSIGHDGRMPLDWMLDPSEYPTTFVDYYNSCWAFFGPVNSKAGKQGHRGSQEYRDYILAEIAAENLPQEISVDAIYVDWPPPSTDITDSAPPGAEHYHEWALDYSYEYEGLFLGDGYEVFIPLGYPSTTTYAEHDLPDYYSLTFNLYSAAEPVAGEGNLTLAGSGTAANINPAQGEGTVTLAGSGEMDANNVTPITGEGSLELSGSGTLVHAPKPVAGEGIIELSASGTMLPVSGLQNLFSLTFNLYSLAEPISGEGTIELTGEAVIVSQPWLTGVGHLVISGEGQYGVLLPSDWPISGSGMVAITGEGAFTNINPVAGVGVITLGAEWNLVGFNLKPFRVRLDDSRRLVAVDSSRRSVSLDG